MTPGYYCHRRSYTRRKIVVIVLHTISIILTSLLAINFEKTEAMSSISTTTTVSPMQQTTNEKQSITRQPQNNHHHHHHNQTRNQTRTKSSSSSNKQNRSSSTSLVRLPSKLNQNNISSAQFSTFLDNNPIYRNEPPLFITPTRDFIVDVAKAYPGKRVTTIQANDGDGDRLEFFLRQASIRDASPYFTINSTSGELRLSTKQFKYRVISRRQEQSKNATTQIVSDDQQEEGEENTTSDNDDDDHNEATQQLINKVIQTKNIAAAESSLNLYFLNVAVSDGQATHDSTVELNIRVTNSTLMKSRELDGTTVTGSLEETVDTEQEVDNLKKLMRDKTREFYAKLDQVSVSPNRHQLLSQGNSSAIVVYPDYINPGLNVDDLTSASTIDSLSPVVEPFETTSSRDSIETIIQDQSALPTTMATPVNPVTATSSPSSSLSPTSFKYIVGSSNEHLANNQTPAAPEPMMVNLIMIMCSCLMIALVLLMFIIPISVKKLRKRLKHVEMQHEQLSQKTSNVSSTIGSSSTTTRHNHHHNHHQGHPSLSQFTLGSDGTCTRGRNSSSSVFRQSSLDSAITITTMPPPPFANHHHHQFNRVDNGSIANPIYLHQQQQQHQRQHYSPTLHESFNQEQSIIRQQQQQMFGLEMPNRLTASENVYCPLSDEFYSTIQADTTPLGYEDGPNIVSYPDAQQTTIVQDFATLNVNSNHYSMAQCAQPIIPTNHHQPDDRRRPTESPDSNASSPTLRSLTRFLSLPARNQLINDDEEGEGEGEGQANKDAVSKKGSSTIRQLELQLGNGPFSTMKPLNNQIQQQQQQFNAKTIARTCNIDREKVVVASNNGCSSASSSSNNWELERHRLRIPWVLLDEGQFGQVWRCKLSFGPRQPERLVAVKSLKNNAANGERGRMELLAEIEIMKLVCEHPNVVKLLHCCTTEDKPILLVMEFIEQGKLQSYLERSRINHHYGTSTFIAPVINNNNNNFIKPSIHQHHQQLPPTPQFNGTDYLTSRDLMKFIYHVAKGMEYISSKCIVHRDLASRNILVSGEKICKIGDFGMARHMQSFADVYERHSGNCKIPVRWMAPEVLLSNSFTTKSDVFSFGILMWEIITLGSTPYTHLKTEQVIESVAKNGERPERPEYCHPQLYDIMSRCWQPEPAARPTFNNLVDILGELMLSANNYIELDQYPDHDYYNMSETAAPNELL